VAALDLETIRWTGLLVLGAGITVALGLCSMLIGIAIGLAGAAANIWGSRLARALAGVYTQLVRGLPELLTILFVYYGAQFAVIGLGNLVGIGPIDLHPFVGGVAALALVFGAYATEVFRGALLAIPKEQLESGLALGLSKWLVFRKVQLPQAWRIALPGLGNLWLVLLKQTALTSAISLEELLRTTTMVVNVTKQPFLYFSLACVLYLIVTSASSAIQRRLEAWSNRGFEPS
jgi:His/Glu/Gln/Arg/opine family amino acid ABC transporter permease subunit